MLKILVLGCLITQSLCQNSEWDNYKVGDDWEGVCTSGKSQSPIDLSEDILIIINSEDDIMTVDLELIGEFSGQFTQVLLDLLEYKEHSVH